MKSTKNAFVHNRVVRIRELCKGFEIRYVNSFDNPADLTTRPTTTNQLKNNNLWKKGPLWLTNKSNWQKEEEKYNLFPIITQENQEWKISHDKIQIKVENLMGQIIAEIDNKNTLKCWKNNYEKTIRFFAIINRLKKKAKKIQYENTPLKQMSANEFAEAERKAIKLMQTNSFEEEIDLLKKRQKYESK